MPCVRGGFEEANSESGLFVDDKMMIRTWTWSILSCQSDARNKL